jgi:hypothetical protein
MTIQEEMMRILFGQRLDGSRTFHRSSQLIRKPSLSANIHRDYKEVNNILFIL